MRYALVLLGTSVLFACTEAIPNRAESPEAAFRAARAGLRNHDLRVYFDSLTDAGVRADLANSVTICVAGSNPAAVAADIKQSVGCESILQRYGWPMQKKMTLGEYKEAISRIQNPRAIAQELEENHRKHGVGSSFVWEYLDNVTVSGIAIRGSHATGLAEWNPDEKRAVEFEKDGTGWRFNPMPREQ
jgi:hypothetical protein